MPPDAADDLADLRRRVEALERAIGRDGTGGDGTGGDGAGGDGAGADGAAGDGAVAAPSSTAVGGAPAVPGAPTVPAERFWALTGLQSALPPGAGGVLFTGHVPLAGGGLAVWQEGRDVDELLDADPDHLAAALSALASPVRLRLLRAVLRGTTGSGELAADDGFGTTGQVHHHLRQLVAAGWLRPTTRGHYAVPVERVVPLLAALAAAAR